MIKAIDTLYNGYKFRSRLEARWAVFFDEIGIEYRYEPEGFDLDGVWYLPDFYLPGLETWVEVKPYEPTEDEWNKCELLAELTTKRVWLTFGDMPYPHPDWTKPESDFPYGSGYMFFGKESFDMPYWFCTCHVCGKIGLQFDGRGARIPCECDHSDHGNGDKCYSADDPILVAAYAKARQARF